MMGLEEGGRKRARAIWHLVGLPSYKNLTEATQLLLARCQAEIVAAGQMGEPAPDESGLPVIEISEWRPKEPIHVKKVRLQRRAGREARYEQVIRKHSEGLTTKEIAVGLGMSQRTVQKWLAAGAFPEAKKRRKKRSDFDLFAPYVLKRWQEGEHNGLILWREIVAQGYTGSDRTVYRHIQTLKQAHVQASLNPGRLCKFTANTAVWLFVRDKKSLDEVEQQDLATFCQASPTLKRAYDLVQDFMQMVRKKEGHRLDAWLERVATSDLPELEQFAVGVEKDKDAVKAGLTWPINNGQVEGQVTKLKRDFTHDVWKGWLSSSPPADAPCDLTRLEVLFYRKPADQTISGSLTVSWWETF